MPSKPIRSWFPKFDKSGNFVEEYGWDVILKHIFTVLATRKGTRQWNPEFGCTLIDKLFDINVTSNEIKECIKTAITKWVPYVTCHDVICNIENMRNRTGQVATVTIVIGYNGESKKVNLSIPGTINLTTDAIYDLSVKRNIVSA